MPADDYRQNATGLGIKESDFLAEFTVSKFDQWWDDNGGSAKILREEVVARSPPFPPLMLLGRESFQLWRMSGLTRGTAC